jgi:hypothetical protein
LYTVCQVFFTSEFREDTVRQPFFVARIKQDNPLAQMDVRNSSELTLVDIDNDSDLDIFVGTDEGTVKFHENTGTPSQPVFVEHMEQDNPLGNVKVVGRGIPTLVDIDNDGDLDAFLNIFEKTVEEADNDNKDNVTLYVGGRITVKYYENIGTIKRPIFVERTGQNNIGVDKDMRLSSWDVISANMGQGWSNLSFVDIDNDGDLDASIKGFTFAVYSNDMVVHGREGNVSSDGDKNRSSSRWDYENIGTASQPFFEFRMRENDPIKGKHPTVAEVDIDGDGDLDAFLGEFGPLKYYENITLANNALPDYYATPRGGIYNRKRQISLNCLECEKIYYTLDGTTPTIASQKYVVPFGITTNTTLKFATVDAQDNLNKVQTEGYIIDTNPPKITITSPISSKAFEIMPLIQGMAFDSEDGTDIDRVELQISNKPLYITGNNLIPFMSSLTWFPVSRNSGEWAYNLKEQAPTGKYTLTARAFDRAGNVAEDKIKITISELFHTTLSLSLISPTLLQNEKITTTGKLQRWPEKKDIDLEGETIQLIIGTPDGSLITENTAKTDSLGNYIFKDLSVFAQKGSYTFKALFPESGDLFKSESEEKTVLVATAAGYAILIQGKTSNEEGLESYNKTLNRVYNTLKRRGFVNENIRYFNYNTQQDSDQDNVEDIFAIPTKAAIQDSIETWLAERVSGSPAPMYLIMIDHGSPDTFYIGDEIIMPTDLKEWLGNLESNLKDKNPKALEEPRFVILGMCYSGSFISELSEPNKNRVIISSAADDEWSYKGLEEEDGIRAGEFFIKELFTQLGEGDSFRLAFEQATNHTEWFTRKKASSKNNRFRDDAAQHPLLDDNGDGFGSNRLSDNDDGVFVTEQFLGVGETNPGETYIVEVTPTQYLDETQTEALLYLKPIDVRKVDPASLEIRSPSKVLETLDSSKPTEQVEVKLERQILAYNGTDRFEIAYEGFQEAGKYEIFYTVRDKDSGDISPIKRSVVYKNKATNQAPDAFELLSPKSETESQTVLMLDWQNTNDPNGDPITYTVSISEQDNFSTFAHQQEELTTSMAIVDNRASLKDLTTYYWKVEAVDQFGAKTTSSEVRTFNTNNPNVPPTPISLNLYNQHDYSGILDAHVTIDAAVQPMIVAEQGHYYFLLSGKPPTLFINVPGYQPKTHSINAVSRQLNEINLAMTPDDRNPAWFSFKTNVLQITVNVPEVGVYTANFRLDAGSEPLSFTLINDAKPFGKTFTNMAQFSVETGQLVLPTVIVIDTLGVKNLYQVEMQLVPDSKPLKFTLSKVNAIP